MVNNDIKKYLVRDGGTPLTTEELQGFNYANEQAYTKLIPSFKAFISYLKANLDIELTIKDITSSFRNEKKNLLIGGSKTSAHTLDGAFDVRDRHLIVTNILKNLNQYKELKALIQSEGLKFIVDYSDINIIHIQVRDFSDKSKLVYSKKVGKFII